MKRIGDFGALQLMFRFRDAHHFSQAAHGPLADVLEQFQAHGNSDIAWGEWFDRDQYALPADKTLAEWVRSKATDLVMEPEVLSVAFSTQDDARTDCSVLMLGPDAGEPNCFQLNVKFSDYDFVARMDVQDLCRRFLSGMVHGSEGACYANASLFTGEDEHFPFETFTIYGAGSGQKLGSFGEDRNVEMLTDTEDRSIAELRRRVIAGHAAYSRNLILRFFKSIFARRVA